MTASLAGAPLANGTQYHVLVDGDQGIVHLRPDENIVTAFRDKTAMAAQAQQRYASIRDKPAKTLDGKRVRLLMNAGLVMIREWGVLLHELRRVHWFHVKHLSREDSL